MGLDEVADGDDDVEVLVLDLPRDLAAALALNRCRFCNGCLEAQLALLEDVLDMPGDDRLVPLEELCHLSERQPGGLSVEAHLDARSAILGL
jgi:hypothetical protein